MIAAAEAEGRYRGRPPTLTGEQLEEVRAAFRDQGASTAGLAREHGVSRVAVRTALADLLPDPRTPGMSSCGTESVAEIDLGRLALAASIRA
ncbi:hypothetical protein GCM10029978_057280 [Actinoallomurus acanthiterrae]